MAKNKDEYTVSEISNFIPGSMSKAVVRQMPEDERVFTIKSFDPFFETEYAGTKRQQPTLFFTNSAKYLILSQERASQMGALTDGGSVIGMKIRVGINAQSDRVEIAAP